MLRIVPIGLREACAYVAEHHRHHKPPRGHKFSLAVEDDGRLCGVAIIGRPVSRHLDDGHTLEVTRCCTDGTRNANSKLYSWVWRVAQRMGYRRVITYTLPEEGGASLRGAGWRVIGQAGGGSWDRAERPRVDDHPLQTKIRWEQSG